MTINQIYLHSIVLYVLWYWNAGCSSCRWAALWEGCRSPSSAPYVWGPEPRLVQRWGWSARVQTGAAPPLAPYLHRARIHNQPIALKEQTDSHRYCMSIVQCCGFEMLIPDPDFLLSWILDLGSRIQQQKRGQKNWKLFNFLTDTEKTWVNWKIDVVFVEPKKLFTMGWIWYGKKLTPDPGVKKKHWIPDPQH